MKLPKLNWLMMTVVLGLTAGLLYAGHNEWHLRVIQNPLRESLSQIVGVTVVDIERDKQKMVLSISVDQGADFPLIASQVYNRVRQEVPYDISEIVWNDNPNEHLQAVREQVNIVLEEARWRYQFVLLQERLEQLTGAKKVSFQLGVDRDNIYLSLIDGTHVLQVDRKSVV